MASKAPPPLIRSSKAFSVEIPEGSNSAKSRRSDIVANDDLDIQHRSSDFDAENTSAFSTGQFKEDAPAVQLLHVDEDPASQDASGFQEQPDDLADRFGPGHDGQHGRDAMAGETDQGLTPRQGPGEDHSHPDKLQGVAQDHLQDNLQGIAQDHMQDNLQGVPQDQLQNNLQEVSEDNAPGSAAQGLPSDNLSDNLQGIAQDHLKDNVQGVAQSKLKDNLQEVAQNNSANGQQGMAKDPLHDHLASVPSDGMEDTYAALPSIHRNLNDGPAPAPSSSTISDHAAPGVSPPQARNKTAAKPADATKHLVAPNDDSEAAHLAQLEKEKKLEEFHGRVEAIRKTVSGINHKLDELDEEPAAPKSKK